MEDRKLTIAIPVYNRYESFEDALLSAVKQVVKVEVIVVDNASSHNKFEEFTKSINLKNVTYYRNTTNLGMYGNWNRCIELCKTEFVMILCSDDLLSPWYSQCFYDKLAQYPQISCFHSKISRFGEPDIINAGHNTNQIFGLHSGVELLKHQTRNGMASIESNTIAFSKSVYPKFQFEFTTYAFNSDWLFCYKAFTDKYLYGMDRVLYEKREDELSYGIQNNTIIPLGHALVHRSIRDQLKEYGFDEYKIAAKNEKWVLRNQLIQGNYQAIEKIISDKENPFGIQIENNLSNDFLSRLIYFNKNLFFTKLLVYYLRFLRRFKY